MMNMATQSILVYIVFGSAILYLGHRVYLAFFKKKETGCGSCPINQNA